ncbi:hypothetical protein QAD02_017736 [Eretmocerus hayati]|uniref:Uncharacterized protein n=1 Tax=Eretmocerus hayati TaxID=131215 RepID=A0ACC2PF70_9HYME|nr:hypothetical protein QAD02_017736 [Eretmocerus hayati]
MLLTFTLISLTTAAGVVSAGPHHGSRNSRQEQFQYNDYDDEKTGGCYISYRSVAFVFVFFLAVVIASAFIGVYIGSPPEKDFRDALAELSRENDRPEKYALSATIRPLHYRLDLHLTPMLNEKHVRLKGRMTMDFTQNGTEAPSQLVLNSKSLIIQSYQLFFINGTHHNSTTHHNVTHHNVARRHRRDIDAIVEPEEKVETTTMPPVETTTKLKIESTTAHHDHMQAEKMLTRSEIKISGNRTENDEGVYVVLLEKPLHSGRYLLEIEYESTLDNRVMFMRNYTKNDEERLLLVSKLKPANAPRLFPTLDEAKSKANFTLTILHPVATQVLSNAKLARTHESNDTLRSEFHRTRPISAHNLALVLGSNDTLVEIESDGPMDHWGDLEQKSQEFYLRSKLEPLMQAYEEVFAGIQRPADKLDLVAVPMDFDGLSAPGIVVVKESLYFTESGAATTTKIKALRNLVSLVGQQWLGGLVDGKNWTDAWFIEGSVVYFQYALLDKIDNKLKASDNFLVDVELEAMENDGFMLTKSLKSKVDPFRVEAFDLIEKYRKGACVINMLHAVLSEDSFKTGYAEFLRRWSYSTVDSDQFLHTLAGNKTAANLNDSSESKTLAEALSTFVRQPGYPLINVTWHRQNGTVVIRQGKFNFDELSNSEASDKSDQKWWVPLTYVTSSSSSSSSEGNWSDPTIVWLKGEREITLKDVPGDANDSWIIFNVNKRGYYRVNYDEASWSSIASVLRNQSKEIPISTRASIIDDAFSLARHGSVPYETALELLGYLAKSEREYPPWRAFARHAAQLDFVLYETHAYPSFRTFMQRLVSPLFDELEPKIDHGSPLVMLAIDLACNYEYHKCTSWAKNKWENIYRKGIENTLMKHIRKTVYCVGAQRGGQEELAYLTRAFRETSDRDEKDRLLSAFGCFDTPWILQMILHEILETNDFEDHDVRVILRSYAKNPAAAQAARRFVQEHWAHIMDRFSNSYWTLKGFIEAATNLLSTEYDLNEFNNFRDQNIDSLKPMGHWVALNEIKASAWIFRLKESLGNIQNWLRNHTSLIPVDSDVSE